MKVLVTGGAGYIGSHVVRALWETGHQVAVFDNLSSGSPDTLPPGVPLEQGDIRNPGDIASALAATEPDAVVHMAALIAVGESVRKPLEYYETNVSGGINLLLAMRDLGVKKIVFSSSAAIYGPPEEVPIPEQHPKRPVSPYGRSKWMFEQVLSDAAAAFGIGAVSLRYFNAAGAHPSGEIGERHSPETHLIPLCLKAAATGEPLSVFGTDYDTRDGTAERDYFHVWDLARAHAESCRICAEGRSLSLNCGTGKGYTVLEVIEACSRVTGLTVPFCEAPRRPGDAPVLVASARRMKEMLGFEPERSDIETIVEDAWRFHRRHSEWAVKHNTPGTTGTVKE